MPSLKVKRGTRAQLNTAATANGLKEGEPYLITDESRIAIGLSASTFDAAAKFSEIGSSLLFGSTLANGTTLTVATHGNRRLPVNGGTVNLPADASWPTDVTFEFVSVGTTPTVVNWTGNAIVSQDTGSLASQTIGGALTATAIVKKMSAGVAYIYPGTAKGLDAIAVTLGTNPNTPAVGATAAYNFVNAAGLALEGLYQFSGIVGTFRVATIAGNSVTLENVSATVGASVPAGTKLAPTGIKGDPGAAGVSAIATMVGVQLVTPGLGMTANYTVDNTAGLILGAFYGLTNISGTFQLTNILSSTLITLTNISATVGATVAPGTRLGAVGKDPVDPLAAYRGGLYSVITPSTTTSFSVVGGTVTTGGNISTPTLASTSAITSTRRTALGTGTTAGAVTFVRSGALMCFRGNAVNRGGFRLYWRFGVETLAVGNRIFVGLYDVASNPTNVDLLTATAPGKIGLFAPSETGNWRLVNNLTGAAPTVLDLGATFAINTTEVMELDLRCLPNSSGVSYFVTNRTTGAVASGTLTTNIPANNTFLAPVAWATNNATAGPCSISSIYQELTTPN